MSGKNIIITFDIMQTLKRLEYLSIAAAFKVGSAALVSKKGISREDAVTADIANASLSVTGGCHYLKGHISNGDLVALVYQNISLKALVILSEILLSETEERLEEHTLWEEGVDKSERLFREGLQNILNYGVM